MVADRSVEFPELTEEQRRVHRARQALRRDGASPRGALELLASIVEDETWRQVPAKAGRPYERFTDFVANELEVEPDTLLKVLALRHPGEANSAQHERMERLRQKVTELLETDSPLSAHGGPRASVEQADNMSLPKYGTSESYNRKRLRRNRPDLLAKVDAGELSASAAAITAGWQKRKVQVVPDEPASVARILAKHMSPEAIAQLKELL